MATLQAISLMYHDVYDGNDHSISGFPSPHAAVYKLTRPLFEEHLAGVSQTIDKDGWSTTDRVVEWGSGRPVLFTFDDGGATFLHPIADLLEGYGWRGHFFITTNYIGAPGFLKAEELTDLRRRGHVIGSHSCSHPTRMSACSREQQMREWSGSIAVLQDILGEKVTTASVAGGYYDRQVAETAATSGIKILFNSEPVTRGEEVNGCTVLGRYAMQRGTTASECAALASGKWLPAARQRLFWDAKKVAKAVGGKAYVKASALLLR